MAILYASILNETEKIFLKKRNIMLMIITALCIVTGSFGITMLQNKLGIAAITGSGFSIFLLSPYVKIFLPLFIFMIGADLFSGEAGDNTLKLALTRPVDRLRIFISKNAAIIIYAVVNLLAVLLISSAAGLFFGETGDIFGGLLKNTSAYLIDIVPAAALILVTSFIAQLFKSSTSTLTTCILIYIGLYILSLVLPIVNMMAFTSFLDWHLLFTGGNVAITTILIEFVRILSYIMIFFSLGYYLFDIKEI